MSWASPAALEQLSIAVINPVKSSITYSQLASADIIVSVAQPEMIGTMVSEIFTLKLHVDIFP